MSQSTFFIIVFLLLGGLYFYVESQSVNFSKNVGSNLGDENAQVIIGEDGNEGETDFVPSENSTVSEISIDASAQRAGKNITISQVNLAEPGYVVVYENVDDNATTMLGSSVWLPAGGSTNVSVPLTRDTLVGEQVWAILFRESNDDGSFNEASDAKATDAMGESVSSLIEISN